MHVAQLEFDESMAEQLEVLYLRRDLVRRRRLVQEALAARPGERVLDMGCGSGFHVAELLDRVGREGSVTGVDRAPAMLAVAAKRAEGRDNVAFYESDATKLPAAPRRPQNPPHRSTTPTARPIRSSDTSRRVSQEECKYADQVQSRLRRSEQVSSLSLALQLCCPHDDDHQQSSTTILL